MRFFDNRDAIDIPRPGKPGEGSPGLFPFPGVSVWIENHLGKLFLLGLRVLPSLVPTLVASSVRYASACCQYLTYTPRSFSVFMSVKVVWVHDPFYNVLYSASTVCGYTLI